MWPFRHRAERGSPEAETARLGRQGERLARGLLRKQGMKILAENYRCPAGEADLIALDPSTRKDLGVETIAFVEVKTRRSDRHTPPEAAVNAGKRRRMKKVADYYLASRKAQDYAIRFDIVAVVIREHQEPQIKYIPNAF